MPIPIVYRKAGEGNIASFNFYDIANSTGMITFYGAIDQASMGILTNNVVYSDRIESFVTAIMDGTWAMQFETDYDVIFNTPITMKGVASVNIPLNITMPGAYAGDTYAIAKIRKWNGTTETEIASGTSANLHITAAGVKDHELMMLVEINVPNTVFKRGETLRLTIEIWARVTNPGSGDVATAHDPKNRAKTYFTGTNPTTLILNAPFKIDL